MHYHTQTHTREAPHAVALTLLERPLLTMAYLPMLNLFVHFICSSNFVGDTAEYSVPEITSGWSRTSHHRWFFLARKLVLEAAFKSTQYIHVPMATDVSFIASLTAAAPRSVRRPQEKHRLDALWRR